MSEATTASYPISFQTFRSPKTVLARFVTRRSLKSSVLWALVFGAYVASKAIGYTKAYPTQVAREGIAASFSNNTGLEVLLGPARHIDTVGGYLAWNSLMVTVIIGIIWALLLATKSLRGEEEAGRMELFLSGQTTARSAAANILKGLAVCIGIFFAIIAVLYVAIGKDKTIDISPSNMLFFALVTICTITIFLLVGALTSQLMPTRGRAASLAGGIFGVCFIGRAIADVTNTGWLLDINPLGWVEKTQPLTGNQSEWLIPMVFVIIGLLSLTLYYAGRRDLGAAILSGKDKTKSRYRLLNSVFGSSLRLTKNATVGWLSAITISAFFYGFLTKAAAQAFSQSTASQHVLNKVLQSYQTAGAIAYIGIIFFLQMMIVMVFAASAVNAVRRDEAEGYIDNFLVQPVSRLRWYGDRIVLVVLIMVSAALLTTIGVWVGAANQEIGVSLHGFILAGLNLLVPALFTLAIGFFVIGIRPRLTSLAIYGFIAWSFLIEMLGTGLNLNHWIMDTSILHQLAFAPAVSPNWNTNLNIVIVAVILSLVGMFRFHSRDITSE